MSTQAIDRSLLQSFRDEIQNYLVNELLPFWFKRSRDLEYGGFITHFDKDGLDSGENEKSLIAQSRMLYTFSSAYRSGYGMQCREFAEHALTFLLEKMWDEDYGGFYWMVDRQGKLALDDKILYGHNFVIYSLSEYTLATGDPRGLDYATQVFDLIQKYCTDTLYGGYFEMFDRQWRLAGPGSKGGDRKTLDAHMHLMEAVTTLYECSRDPLHRRKLIEIIELIVLRLLHPKYATGIPQFTQDWQPVAQIKFDIVWGWDRFRPDGLKADPLDNTSYGHNVELAWLMMHALDILGLSIDAYRPKFQAMLDHAVVNGIDYDYGGVYVEGPHAGGVHDREKEFWQQCELMIGMLDAYLRFQDPKYLDAYAAVHRFMFSKGIHHNVGELWPLLTREGEPIWTHMSHSWKINYHSVRAMIKSREKLDAILSC